MLWLQRAIDKAGGIDRVAEASGLSVSHIYNILAARRAITPGVARRLAAALPLVKRAKWIEAAMGPTFGKKVSNTRATRQARASDGQ